MRRFYPFSRGRNLNFVALGNDDDDYSFSKKKSARVSELNSFKFYKLMTDVVAGSHVSPDHREEAAGPHE